MRRLPSKELPRICLCHRRWRQQFRAIFRLSP
ncbi:hypothetical protein [Sneathiella sp.]